MTPLNARQIELLIRSALIEDATSQAERLAALMADISIDEDGEINVALDVDMWPEDKEPIQAHAVADALGVHLEETASIIFPAQFPWPGLAHKTNSTAQHVAWLLDGYEQHPKMAAQ